MRIGVIAGATFYAVPGEEILVETPWGQVPVRRRTLGGRETFVLPRHGPRHERPAHKVEHRANVEALASCRVERVLAVNTVGSLRKEIVPGSFVVVDDFIDFRGVATTFFDARTVHVDVTRPYCPEVRSALLAGAEGKAPLFREGVYACTAGPRLETPAEVRRLARDAHVVGMTGAPEATLARERGLCYASLCIVVNHAAGLTGPLRAAGFGGESAASDHVVKSVLEDAIRAIPERRGCQCASAEKDGTI